MRIGSSNPLDKVTGPEGGAACAAPEDPDIRWAGSGPADRRAEEAVRSLPPHPPAEHLSPDWDIGWPLVRVLIRVLARILGRTLVGILSLVLILRRAIGRGDLSILRIGRRSCLAPVTLLARRRCLLCVCCADAAKAGASTILAPSAPESTHCKRFLLFKSIL